jgi:hypothetical protein
LGGKVRRCPRVAFGVGAVKIYPEHNKRRDAHGDTD